MKGTYVRPLIGRGCTRYQVYHYLPKTKSKARQLTAAFSRQRRECKQNKCRERERDASVERSPRDLSKAAMLGRKSPPKSISGNVLRCALYIRYVPRYRYITSGSINLIPVVEYFQAAASRAGRINPESYQIPYLVQHPSTDHRHRVRVLVLVKGLVGRVVGSRRQPPNLREDSPLYQSVTHVSSTISTCREKGLK